MISEWDYPNNLAPHDNRLGRDTTDPDFRIESNPNPPVFWAHETPMYHCPIHGDTLTVATFTLSAGGIAKHFCMECWIHEMERTIGSIQEVRLPPTQTPPRR